MMQSLLLPWFPILLGVGIGGAGNVAFYRGLPETTRISSGVGSLIVTTEKQLLFNAKLDISSLRNRRAFRGDNRLYWTSQDTYGPGTSTTRAEAANAKYEFFRFYESLYRQAHPSRYLGAGFLYNLHGDVRPGEGSESAWAAVVLWDSSIWHGTSDFQPQISNFDVWTWDWIWSGGNRKGRGKEWPYLKIRIYPLS